MASAISRSLRLRPQNASLLQQHRQLSINLSPQINNIIPQQRELLDNNVIITQQKQNLSRKLLNNRKNVLFPNPIIKSSIFTHHKYVSTNLLLQGNRMSTLLWSDHLNGSCSCSINIRSLRFFGDKQEPVKKLTIFQRFKQMYRDYWYVLVPVHLVTSAAWFGSFYYLAKSGMDIVAIMESWKVSEIVINPLKDSSMGYLAVSYALYKIATPLRYTITLGGTTVSINYLKKWGYIKPVPSTQKLKELYQEKKETIIGQMKDKKEDFALKKEKLKDQTEGLLQDVEKKLITKIQGKEDKSKH